MSRSKAVRETGTIVELSNDELKCLALNHVSVVEGIARRFDGNYLFLRARIQDYRDYLNNMEENLKRAEALMENINDE